MSIKSLRNPEGKLFPVGNMSAGQLSKVEGIAGNIGKTAILELMRGQKQQVKGWTLQQQEVENVKRANKQGVEYCGKNLSRERKPMSIRVSLTDNGKVYASVKAAGDFKRFLANADGKEYNEIAASLGWSRDYVAIYAARAVNLGLAVKERKSGAIYGRKE